jgi:hypothetical protein
VQALKYEDFAEIERGLDERKQGSSSWVLGFGDELR